MNRTLSRPRVLIIHPGTLGDVILALNAIRCVQAMFLNYEYTLLVRGEIGRLFIACGVVDHVMDLEGPVFSALLENSTHRNQELIELLSRYKYAVAWVNDPEGLLCKNLRGAGITPYCIASPHNPYLKEIHQSARYCETLDANQSKIQDESTLLIGCTKLEEPLLNCSLPSFGTKKSQKVLFVHPGSGSQHKCLSPERLGHIIQSLADLEGLRILICEGPADEERVSSLQHFLQDLPYETLKDSDLIEVAQVLQSADVYLGHDSGITHLAAALGVPTIALFGPTDSKRWRPLGPHVKVIQGPPCQCPNWPTVQQCSEKRCLSHSIHEVVKVAEFYLSDVMVDAQTPVF